MSGNVKSTLRGAFLFTFILARHVNVIFDAILILPCHELKNAGDMVICQPRRS